MKPKKYAKMATLPGFIGTPKRKKKEKSLEDTLKKKLDTAFSQFIRLRDSDDQGVGCCVTCGKPKVWKYADCGHFIKRQHMATRYDEQNCNLQCKGCNAFEQGANERYRVAIDKKWGQGTSDRLEARKKNRTRFPAFWYKMEIERYEKLVKERLSNMPNCV